MAAKKLTTDSKIMALAISINALSATAIFSVRAWNFEWMLRQLMTRPVAWTGKLTRRKDTRIGNLGLVLGGGAALRRRWMRPLQAAMPAGNAFAIADWGRCRPAEPVPRDASFLHPRNQFKGTTEISLSFVALRLGKTLSCQPPWKLVSCCSLSGQAMPS